MKLFPNLKYRISRDRNDQEWPYIVESKRFFLWTKKFQVATEEHAIAGIKNRIAKKYREPIQILREYTEADYLIDKLKNG